MSKTIAIFRYHKYVEVCANHLDLFRKINPDIEIHGIYGGERKEYEEIKSQLHLDSDFFLENLSDETKWKSFDIVLKEWYRQIGKGLSFDRIFLLEWDLLIFKSIAEIFPNLSDRQLAFSGLVSLCKIEKKWYWTSNESKKLEWESLKSFIKDGYNFSGPYFACVCPGMNISRKFLESIEFIDLPEYCNDELRFTIYADLAGFELRNSRFFKKWFSKKEFKYFNCNGFDVHAKIILKELNKSKGRRVFHPYRKTYNIQNELFNGHIRFNYFPFSLILNTLGKWMRIHFS